MKKRQGKRNGMDAFAFVDISSMSKANLHPQSDLLAQNTTNLNATQSTPPHTVTQPKVVNVVHREIDGDHVSTLNMFANIVPSLPSIESTSRSQILNNSANDEVSYESYHPMLIDESDVVIPELDDIVNQQARRQV